MNLIGIGIPLEAHICQPCLTKALELLGDAKQ